MLARMLLLALLALLGCSGAPEPTPPAPPTPPDLILVVVDTLRADRLGAYGYPKDTSPALDALAAEGLVFERAYAQSGWTLPSMASLISGTLPHQHRVLRDFDSEQYGALSEAHTTLGEALSAAGYATGAVLNNSFLHPVFGLGQGFDRWDHQGASHDTHRTAPDAVADGLRWLDEQEKPAFLLLHLMEPHLDYGAPEPWRLAFTPPGAPPVPVPFGADQRWLPWLDGEGLPPPEEQAWIAGLYDGEIRATDEAIAALVAGLEARGRRGRTVLAVTSDHGEELFDHGRFEHGHSLRSPVTRIPMVLTGPGIPTGRREEIVQHLDLYQTLLALGGAARPPQTGGQDLRAIPEGADRVALSEGCLYKPGCLSLVTRSRRLLLNTHRTTAALARIDERGREHDDLGEAQVAEESPSLIETTRKIRGGLAPPVPAPGPSLQQNDDVIDALISLGYLGSGGERNEKEKEP